MARYPVLLVLSRCFRFMENTRFSPRIGHAGNIVSVPVWNSRWITYDSMSERSVRFFTNTCSTCMNDVAIPLLGDFAYGELIFQTIDGKQFALAEVILDEAWSLISKIAAAECGFDKNGVTPALSVFQRVAMHCADPLGGKRFATRFPLCPLCASPISHYRDDRISHDAVIPRVTWRHFLGLSAQEQKNVVKLYWKDEVGQRGGPENADQS
jgi:hypothetical protein